MFRLFGFFLQGLFYAGIILLSWPWLMIFKTDRRSPGTDDGIELGYDDNDPGESVDD